MSKKQNKWPLDGRVTRSKSINGTNTEEKLAKGKDSGRAQQGTSGTSAATYAGVTTSPAASTSTVSVQQEVTGQLGVVYFEPIDTGKEYPTQPVELARILTQKRFKDYREVTKIGRFQFKVVITDAGAENKLKSLNLASHNLKIHLPRKNSSTILFVKGVPLDFGDEEIKDCITTETEVLEVQRIKRRVNENLVDTTNLRITVAGQKVPRLVKIYGCAFKCELYIFPIRQCQNCWRFGHSAKKCTSKRRCRICGRGHGEEDCGEQDHCPNCKGQHRASSKDCAERRRRQKILDTMRTKQIGYKEAEEAAFPKTTNGFEGLEEEGDEGDVSYPPLQVNRQRNNRPEFSGRVQDSSGGANQAEIIRPKGGGCQCPENPFKTTDFERFLDKMRREFLAEVRNQNWIQPLKILQAHIGKKVQEASSELERDQLVVEVANRIQDIIERNSSPNGNGNRTADKHNIDNEIHVALLQEIWLKQKEHFRMAHYRMASQRRNEGWGGVAVLVHESLEFEEIKFHNLLPVEVIAVKVVKGFDPITFVSVYVPPNRELHKECLGKIEKLFEELHDLNGEVLVGGDFNGHHQDWDCNIKPCPKGILIQRLMMSSRMVLMNKQQASTCMTTATRPSSTPDISFATPGLVRKASWEVLNQEFGSLHLCILAQISSVIPVFQSKTTKINQEKAIKLLNQVDPDCIQDPEEMQNILEECLAKASYVVKNKKANYLKRWWNEDIEAAYEAKREQLRRYNKTKSLTNQLELQKRRAVLKRLIRRAKREYNKELSEQVDESTPLKQLWNIIKGLDVALTQQVSAKPEMSEEDGKAFMKHYYDGKLKETCRPEIRINEELKGYERPITVTEILNTLKRKKKHSAPGGDGVSYAIIKGLDLGFQTKLCEMLNHVFVSEEIPERWRCVKVKPIPKQKGDPLSPSSRRPIALMNVNLKLINSTVKDRLNEFAEAENLLPKLSFGFRKNCSAITCVNYLVNRIKEAKREKDQAIGVFLDLSGAFDSVDLNILMKTLVNLGIPGKLISWLFTYLSKRTQVLETDGSKLSADTSEGLPQGCPGSPTVFNFYTIPLHDVKEDGCELIQFADDFAVLGIGDTLEEAANRTNRFLEKLAVALESLNLTLNVSKCAAIAFTNKNHEHLKIKIRREKVEINNTHKYLGFTMDKTLTHRKHIEDVKEKGASKINIIKLLGRRNSGACPDTLVKVGNALIRSKTEYGAPIYGAAAPSNLQKIQTVHNAYLRSAMGYLKTTPIHVIQAEAGQLPVKDRIEFLTLKEILKAKFHGNQLQPFIENAINSDADNGTFLTKIAVKHNDVVCQLQPKDRLLESNLRRVGPAAKNKIRNKLFKGQKPKHDYGIHFWKQKFLEVKQDRYDGFKLVYTDGSKSNDGVAAGVYDDSDQEVLQLKMNENFSITNAELLGIYEGVQMIRRKGYEKAAVITDSQGACLTLNNPSLVKENYLAWEIWKQLEAAAPQDIRVQWVPSHQEIRGNERADEVAVEARKGKQNRFNTLTLGDGIKLAEKEIWDSWTRNYTDISKEKGATHFQYMSVPGFVQVTLSRRNVDLAGVGRQTICAKPAASRKIYNTSCTTASYGTPKELITKSWNT
ncbi:hypothetical protein quinque_001627 [Culex quinquefasciatus]